MTSYVNDMWPGPPPRKDSPAGSGTGRCSRLSSGSRSSSSSASSRAVSSHSERSSASRSRSRSRRRRSRSHSRRRRRRHQRKYRRYSRSYSRSRSGSRGRRSRRSPSRSRSRPRGRSRGRRPALGPRGRRHYGLGRTRWRSRSRSPTPLRLSDKDRMELLEIAKANAAKALGTANIDLPASLKTGLLSKDANYGKQIQNDATKLELSGRFNEDVIKTSNESSSLQRNLPFRSGNSVANPVLQKTTKETARSPKDDEKSQSSYGQWIPVKKEENSLLLSSPKTTLSFKF